MIQEMTEKLNFKKDMNQESSRDPKGEVYVFPFRTWDQSTTATWVTDIAAGG